VTRVDAAREAFQRSPGKSTRRASNELRVPQSTAVKILQKRLKLFAYKVQIVNSLRPDDGSRRASFATEILRRIDEDNDYLKRVCFSDEATFHISGVVNRHNVRIWSSENQPVVFQNQQGSPKVNVGCGLMHNKFIGPFFFNEPIISANVYLDILQLHVAPQLEEFQPWIIFQQDGAPPHWGSHVRRFLDATFPNRWTGRDGPRPWPPRSPDITPLGLFLRGYVKDKVFSTPVPDITSLKTRITDDFATITDDMLENTWREIDYRLDVLRATKGAHVEVY